MSLGYFRITLGRILPEAGKVFQNVGRILPKVGRVFAEEGKSTMKVGRIITESGNIILNRGNFKTCCGRIFRVNRRRSPDARERLFHGRGRPKWLSKQDNQRIWGSTR